MNKEEFVTHKPPLQHLEHILKNVRAGKQKVKTEGLESEACMYVADFVFLYLAH